MTDVYDLFDEIAAVWKEKSKDIHVAELEKRIGRGSTGGEIFSDVVQFFRQIKEKADDTYFAAQPLIDEALARYEKFIKQI